MSQGWFSLHSVRTRLALWNVGVLALVLVVLGTAFRLRMQVIGVAEADHRLAGMAQEFERMADRPPPPPPGGSKPPGPPPPRHRHGGPHDRFRPRLIDLSGHSLFGPPEERHSESPWDARTYALAKQGQQTFSTIQVGSEPLRVLSVPLRRDGQIIGVGQIADTLGPLGHEVDRMTRSLLALIPLALLVAGLGGAFLTDRALRPVRQMSQAASRIEAASLSGRLPVAGRDEFAALAGTFNSMLARLERAFHEMEQAYERQRRFTADASHELRTPLTTIKANTSLALLTDGTAAEYRQSLEAADHAADRTIRLIQDLLLLARADAGEQPLRRESVALPALLMQAMEAIQTPGQAPIRLHLPSSLPCVAGDADALLRLFTNLLENAVRHTPPAGTITVTAQVQSASVQIAVTDTGEGIAPQHLPHLFERFYRVDAARSSSRGGTGLGLAISQSIAEAHGGRVDLESNVGAGTTARVTLPIAQ